MNKTKIVVLLIAAIVIAGLGTFVSIKSPSDGESSLTIYKTVFGSVSLGTDFPVSPENVTLFRVTPRDDDLIRISSNNTAKLRKDVISEVDAPSAALEILANYGGLPTDAEFNSAETSYATQFDTASQQVVAKYPVLTEVQYDQRLNGMPIAGPGGVIIIDLGEKGELLELRKIWRTVTPSGNVKVISSSSAFEKLKHGEVINVLKGDNDINITQIQLGYYEKGFNQSQEYLDPVWIFHGSLPDNSNMTFYVYARQFANFTASPATGKVPLTVTFIDTSDTSPTKWLWDFGDGTNSTEQNPAHAYTTAGTYNVTLIARNDLGSDWMEKPGLITVYNPAPPVANLTASPVTGCAPLNVSFTDLSENGPVTWNWTFGDGAGATVRDPVHTFSAPGNYTVSLNVTNEDGTNSIVKPDYISVTNLPSQTITTQPTTTVTTPITTTAVTTTVTTTTTKPTSTKTHAPLSPVVAMIGIVVTGMFSIVRQRKTR